MHYYSLNHQSPKVNFEDACVKGQAPDKGLYFPEFIPQLPKEFIENLKNYSKEEIGFIVMKSYVAESIDDTTLQQIINETVNFDFPLKKISEKIFSLELFHGPTLAFKDVGARFMSRCLAHFNKNKHHHTTVLVATSGDTGGAVANGFLNVEGVDVIILYPSKKVSEIQELQLTTLGKNITAIEVQGNFDDCQAMVKKAFTDIDLQKKLSLTSANSINVARWLPQQLYYFFALQQWNENEPTVFSVPSGNFGNICAGIVAYKSGLPAKHFIAACNANDVVPDFLQNGIYTPKAATATVSNAMDVGDPSNFVRVMELFEQKTENLKSLVNAVSIDDDATKATIKNVFEKHHYMLDPHGAVGYFALENYLQSHLNDKGIFLETAHPVKFPQTVEEAAGKRIPIPENIKYLLSKEKKSILMKPDFEIFKEWLLTK
jgi:threonine synthase